MKSRCAIQLVRSLLAGLLAFSLRVDAAGVAVVDTGVSPSLISGLERFMMSGGYDFVNGDANPSDDNGHGTVVAATLAAHSLLVQGSTDARNNLAILPIKVLDASGRTTTPIMQNGVAFAANDPRVRIINLSLGAGGNFFDWQEARFFQDVARAGKMLIMAAGNSGAPGPFSVGALAPALGGWGIAVGATDNNGNIRPYSNRAGAALNEYLLAPDDWFNVGTRGTSFAAPVVAAAASIVMDNAPHLIGAEVGRLLCLTADDLGAPGNDRIYGCGIVNPWRALGPVGTTSIPTGTQADGEATPVIPSALRLSPAVAFAVTENSTRIGELIALDDFKRSYPVALEELIEVNDTTVTLSDFSSRLLHGDGLSELFAHGKSTIRAGFQSTSSSHYAAYRDAGTDESTAADVTEQFSFRYGEPQGVSYLLERNTDPQSVLGFGETSDRGDATFLAAFEQPYLGFGEIADTAALGFGFGDVASLRLGIVNTRESGSYGLDSTAAVLRGAFDVGERLGVGIHLSNLVERGSLLGGSAGGPLGVDDSDTLSLGLSANYRLTDRFSLVSHYAYGRTDADDARNSLLHDFSDVRHETYGVGLLGHELFREGDALGVALSRPVRITDGTVTLTTPYARDISGNISSHSERISLAPQGAETDLELFYRFDAGRNTRVGFHALYRDEPYHSDALGAQGSVFAVVSRRF